MKKYIIIYFLITGMFKSHNLVAQQNSTKSIQAPSGFIFGETEEAFKKKIFSRGGIKEKDATLNLPYYGTWYKNVTVGSRKSSIAGYFGYNQLQMLIYIFVAADSNEILSEFIEKYGKEDKKQQFENINHEITSSIYTWNFKNSTIDLEISKTLTTVTFESLSIKTSIDTKFVNEKNKAKEKNLKDWR